MIYITICFQNWSCMTLFVRVIQTTAENRWQILRRRNMTECQNVAYNVEEVGLLCWILIMNIFSCDFVCDAKIVSSAMW